MKILITGANGFIARNLTLKLHSLGVECIKFTRKDSVYSLKNIVRDVDFIFHLAGVNRPDSDSDFYHGNVALTKGLCDACLESASTAPIVYASSTQVKLNNPYGISKLQAENILVEFQNKNQSSVFIYRLPGVFGRLARANYNSVVATFCHNAANNIPLKINDPSTIIKLVYIDRVVESFVKHIGTSVPGIEFPSVDNVFELSVGRLAKLIDSLKNENSEEIQGQLEKQFLEDLRVTYSSFLDK